MNRVLVLALRALIVLMIALVLLTQVIVFPFVAEALSEESGRSHVAVLYPVMGALYGLCVQFVLVAIWALLTRVRRGTVFSAPALRWVDGMIAAGLVAAALTLALAIHLYLVVEPPLDAPGLVAISLVVLVVSSAFTLLVAVMRTLLTRATAQSDELAQVV